MAYSAMRMSFQEVPTEDQLGTRFDEEGLTEDMPKPGTKVVEEHEAYGISHLPEVDGLRAVAVIPVVLYHFDLGCPGGYAGVDVFFVISGFLITSILLPKLSSGSLSLLDFWTRRVRRLFPALAVMLAALLSVGNFVLLNAMYSSLARQTWMVLLLAANLHFFSQESYFTAKNEQPLLHCWSLAVEEQFYLVYPALLWSSWTVGGCRCLFVTLLAIFLSSLALSILTTPTHVKFAFYLLPTRAWELSLGGMLALKRDYFFFQRKAAAELSSWVGLIMIATSYFLYDRHTPYPGYHALIPCVGAGLFIASQGSSRTSGGRMLAMGIPVFIGKMSYSWYLWHWPVFVFLTYYWAVEKLDTKWTTVGVISSFAVAVLSYLLIEPTFRAPKKVPDKLLYLLVAAAWLIIFFTSWGLFYSCVGGIHGAPVDINVHAKNISANEIRTIHIDMRISSGDADDPGSSSGNTTSGNRTSGNMTSGNTTESQANYSQASSDETCLVYLSDAEIDSLYAVDVQDIHTGNILETPKRAFDEFQYTFHGYKPYMLGPEGHDPSVAVIGTSHCTMLGPALKELAPQYNIRIAIICKDGSPRFEKPPRDWWEKDRLAVLDQWKWKLIVWVDFWGGDTTPCDWYNGYDFEYAFNLLSSRTEQVLVLGDIPTLPVPKMWGYDALKMWALNRYKEEGSWEFLTSLYEEPDWKQCRLAVEANISAALEATLGHRGKFVEMASYMREESSQHLQLIDPDNGTLVYCDYSHLNADGAKRLEQLFRREIFHQAICDT